MQPPTDLTKLAAQAYVYGFPLVFDLEQVNRLVTVGLGASPATPFNVLNHVRALAGAEDTFVSINNDTVYSFASVDLGVGPLLFHVPDTAGRYYVMQFVDAWTNNFAYVGSRGTGTDAGDFLLVPPGWTGTAPNGVTVIRFPTRVATIVGRWACAGEDDLPAVHALQDATTLTALARDVAPAVRLPPVPESDDPVLDFFEKYRIWSREFPPAARDVPMQESFAPLGLTGPTPVRSLDPSVRDALRAGYADGRTAIERSVHDAGSKVNGWKMTLHVFDYNLDFFEVGSIDSAQWKITDPESRIVTRATAAVAGLWGNHGYEAAYVMTYEDADGNALTGEHTYTLTLSPPPPVGAFWSVTMYNLPHFYLVPNPIDRYSIGDRTPGIEWDANGGITITMSHEPPSGPANWLPTPADEFRPVLRMYVPDPAIVDGSYAPSPICRA